MGFALLNTQAFDDFAKLSWQDAIALVLISVSHQTENLPHSPTPHGN
jgi:hypothetical protein